MNYISNLKKLFNYTVLILDLSLGSENYYLGMIFQCSFLAGAVQQAQMHGAACLWHSDTGDLSVAEKWFSIHIYHLSSIEIDHLKTHIFARAAC